MNENVQEKKPETVPYIVYESALARQEDAHRRECEAREEARSREREKDKKIIHWMIGAVIAMAVVVFGSLIGFLVYESQYETINYSQDGEGLNNINTGEQGDVYGTDAPHKAEEERQGESDQST